MVIIKRFGFKNRNFGGIFSGQEVPNPFLDRMGNNGHIPGCHSLKDSARRSDRAGSSTPPFPGISQPGYRRLIPAKWARLVLPDLKHPIVRLEGVIHQETADQRVSDPQNELEYLRGLDQANLPGHHAQDTYLASGWDELITRRVGIRQDGGKALDCRLNRSRPSLETGSASPIRKACRQRNRHRSGTGGEIIRPIEDKVELPDQVEGISRDDALIDGHHINFGIEPVQRLPGGVHLWFSDVGVGIQHLPIEASTRPPGHNRRWPGFPLPRRPDRYQRVPQAPVPTSSTWASSSFFCPSTPTSRR